MCRGAGKSLVDQEGACANQGDDLLSRCRSDFLRDQCVFEIPLPAFQRVAVEKREVSWINRVLGLSVDLSGCEEARRCEDRERDDELRGVVLEDPITFIDHSVLCNLTRFEDSPTAFSP